MTKLKCLTCSEELGLEYFSKTKNYSKNKDTKPFHYWVKKCKKCQGVKTLYGTYNTTNKSERLENKVKGIILSKEATRFLKVIKEKSGYVDMLDSFKLAHYFLEAFGYIDIDDLQVEDQLILMYEKLLKANGNTTV